MDYRETPVESRTVLAPDSLQRLAFSEKCTTIAARSSIVSSDICIPSEEHLLSALAMVRSTMAVASTEVVTSVYRHNPECFRVVWRDTLASSPMMAYLPLNAEGTAKLINGMFDPSNPDLRLICRAGEQPDSIYLWLMYTPGKMTAGIRLLLELERYGRGATIFTRPAHKESARILGVAGFVPVNEFFPNAEPTLLFTLSLPADNKFRGSKSTITVRVARTLDDIAKVFSIRTATYMCEQYCSYVEEFDGNDFTGTQLLGEVNGEPAGCVRIRYFGEFAKIERFAVRSEFRRSRLMRELARYALDFCARKGFKKIYGHVRLDLVPAWEKMFHARPLQGRQPFTFSDVEYREMVFEMPHEPAAIHLGCDPLMIIRPEGEWDRLGPIEKAQFVCNSERREKIGDIKKFCTS